jgi:hypothetical protein
MLATSLTRWRLETMSDVEMTNGMATHETKPGVKRARKRPKKRASAASSKPASAPKKRRGEGGGKKKTGAMAKQGRYVLVIHFSSGSQAKLDRAVKALAKKTGKRESRSSYARTIVEKSLK